MALLLQNHEIICGEDNLLEIDLNTDLDAGDEVWYTAKYSRSDPDAEAAISKQRSQAEIVDVDTAAGKCQVKILRADTLSLTGRALMYDVKVKKVDQSTVMTVGTGVAFLLNPVNKDAA